MSEQLAEIRMGETREEWRAIPGWDGYEASSLGRLRRGSRIFNPAPSGSAGRPRTTLSRNGKPKTVFVHTLIALAFLGPRPTRHEVNHKNGDKTHNAADNLEYVTRQANIQHAYKLGLIPSGAQKKNAIFTAEQVADIRARVAAGEPKKRLARRLGVSAGAIQYVVLYGWRHTQESVG